MSEINQMFNILDAVSWHACNNSDQIAVQGSNTRLSYSELHQEVQTLATLLESSGWRTVAVMLGNSPAWVVIDLAAEQAGVILVPLPSFFSESQVTHSLRDAGVNAVITDQPERFTGFSRSSLCKNIAGTALNCLVVPASLKVSGVNVPADTIKVTYTSGTTGTSKGVCLSGNAIDQVSRSLAQRSQVRADDIHICLLPLATLLENIGGIYVPLLAGATIAVPSLGQVGMLGASGVHIDLLIKALEQYKATRAILLPQMLQSLIERLEVGSSVLPRLRFLAVGGAPVPPTLLQRAEHLGLPVFQGYGLSECCSVVALNNEEHNRPESVGKPLCHVGLRFNTDGEIMVKGSLFNGYLGGLPRVVNGWWPTGDFGYLDDDGYLFITGRKKNMFITSYGRNVAPEWVEQELVLSPFIAQAFVYGEARPWNIAVLVSDATDAQVQAAVSNVNIGLPDYARVSCWLRADKPFSVANELMTATGRLRRKSVLRAYDERIEATYLDFAYIKENL